VRRRAIAVVGAALVAGCGSSSTPATTTTHRATSSRPGCPHAVASAVGAGATARLVSDDASTLVCDYAGGGARVRVTIDSLPQAYERWNRAQVETWQNYAGWNDVPSRAPRIINGVGVAAFWIPHDRRLVTTGGGRLITVIVRTPRARAAALRLARATGRRALPPAHGAPAASHGP
jgi:hypothetical protein